jgi:hypothetical protein
MLEGREGPTGTAVFDKAERIPLPKGPPKSSVGGMPDWSSSSARWYGWPPPDVDLSVRRGFRPGRSPASKGSGVAKIWTSKFQWPHRRPAPQGCTVTLVLRVVGVSLTSYSHIVQREIRSQGGPRFVGRSH